MEESVKKLCKDEYGLDVDVEILGSTLGVYIPIEGLVNEQMKLDEEAEEKINDVALSIYRVTMSSDRPLKIFTLTARDTKTYGAEFIVTGALYDVVRFRLLDISRGEHGKRILRDFKFNPTLTSELKVRELFVAVNEDSSSIQQIKPLFYPIHIVGQKNSQRIEIIDVRSKEISSNEALLHVKTKEYYTPRPEFAMYSAIFPSGFENEYLFLSDIATFPSPIKEIIAKYFPSGTDIRERDLQEIFNQYEDVGYIGVNGLPKRELTIDWFLAEQIARRIKFLFAENKLLDKRFTVEDSKGLVQDKLFQFTFSITPSGEPKEDDREIILSNILKLIAKIFHRYWFDDFEGVMLIDTNAGGQPTYLSKDELARFRKGRIKPKDIINNY
ncbi:MAG: hypothetical protein QGI05_02705 [Candidatus Omnitrophota bacterium]|nr:hypothetical protein [Candidatus Omnitrophota bacterium]